MSGGPPSSAQAGEALPERALIVGVDVERSAVLGMAFDEMHLTGLDDYPEHLAAGSPWPCVVISGVPTRAGRLASVVSAALASQGPIEILIDIREPYGADVLSHGAAALTGLHSAGVVDLWGVPCLRLGRAADPDSVPDLSSGAGSLDMRPAPPADRATVPVEVHTAAATRYENRIAELQTKIEQLRARSGGDNAPAEPSGPSPRARSRPWSKARGIRRLIRPGASGPAPAEADTLRTLRKEIAGQRDLAARLSTAVVELTDQLHRVELNIAVGAASSTETARHMHSLPAALAEQLGLAPASSAQLVLFLADRVRRAEPRAVVVCGNEPTALWLAHMMRHHGVAGRVVLVTNDAVGAALVDRSATADGVAELLEIRAPQPLIVEWRNGKPIPPSPPAPVVDLKDVGLVVVGLPSGGPDNAACPLRPEQLADDVLVLLASAGSWTGDGWPELLKGLDRLEKPSLPGWVVMARGQV